MSAAPPAVGIKNQEAPPTTLLLQGIVPHLFQTKTKKPSSLDLRRRTVTTGSMLKKQMHNGDPEAEADDTPKASQSSKSTSLSGAGSRSWRRTRAAATRTLEEAQAEIRRLESEVQRRDKQIAALRTTLAVAQSQMDMFIAIFQQHNGWLASREQ
ncbi:hypothetical protein C8R45DRAFT_1109361 [Mycena sanguinolenta]|nr:hypothetical protein C8R45DRAFT_1109361 [Mycena sanguinolenta]